MIFILMMLALADITIAVKGTSVYYHTEKSCSEGHRENLNYDDYSVEAGIDRNKCWGQEVESNTVNGARRQSVWVAPRLIAWGVDHEYCLWSYPADNAKNDCTSDGVVTMDFVQNDKEPLCYNIAQEGADGVEFGSFWIVPGACKTPTFRGEPIDIGWRDKY